MAVAAADLQNHHCTLCEEDGINNLAYSWCTECETFLCADCEKHHSRNKASKNHKTIPSENYKELPTFITSTSPQCEQHGKRFELYCSFHQVACCLECITKNHNKCNEIRELADVLKDFKASSSVDHMGDDLRDIQNNLDKITKYLKSRLGDIDTQKTKDVKQITDMRRSINDHLDRLEQKLRNDLDDKYIKIKSGIEHLLKEIEYKQCKTNQLETDFNKMKKFATELQTFVGITKIKQTTNEIENYLTGTKRKNLVERNDLEIELFSEILQVESLGNVNVSSVPVSLQLTLRKEQQACLQVQNPDKIDQIKPKLLKKIVIGKQVATTGCQILPTGQMLFLDQREKCLMLFSEDGSFVRVVVTFTKAPYDVTYIKDNTVAVTTYIDRKVHLVDIDRNLILKSTNMSDNCYGIDSDDKVIIINCGNFKTCKIISFDFDGKSELVLQSDSSDIAMFGERIYVAEYNDNRVKCLSKNGDVLWTYQLTEGRYPRGLSVGKHGFVYVTCRGSNSVAVISANGKEGCTILTKDDGIVEPWTLNINRNTSKLLVANSCNGEAFLYQM